MDILINLPCEVMACIPWGAIALFGCLFDNKKLKGTFTVLGIVGIAIQLLGLVGIIIMRFLT